MKYYLCLTIHPRYEDDADYRFYLLRELEEGLEGNFLGPGNRLLITATPAANLDGAMIVERTGCRRQRAMGDVLIIVDGYLDLTQVPPIKTADDLSFLSRSLNKFGFKEETQRPSWLLRINHITTTTALAAAVETHLQR